MANYYNENDSRAAAWLRQLIIAGLIPWGEVDDRSITDVRPSDLKGFTQCHFFAGIGGWSLALQLAGWPANRPVWTGSCPCQPFSVAGQQGGVTDPRHLWPEMYRLVAECQPARIFGEQVASKDGRGWLAGVRVDLEAVGYAVGGADLCAASIGAPHIRQRLYWVADRNSDGFSAIPWTKPSNAKYNSESCGTAGGLGVTENEGLAERVERPGIHAGAAESSARQGFGVSGAYCGLSDAAVAVLQGQSSAGHECQYGENDNVFRGWGDNWIACADGKARRIEPGLSPLAHGIPARVVRLRGYGNAIVPRLAAEFVLAAEEALI